MTRKREKSVRTVSIAAACALAITGCTARDEAPVVDSSASIGTPTLDSSALPTIPEPLPSITDSVLPPVIPPRDMPPVAGETKKPIETRERDSVTEPQFEVGTDGKVRPIKR